MFKLIFNMIEMTEREGINTINTTYTLSLIKSIYNIKKKYCLSELELRIVLFLYDNPGYSQYKVHLMFYGEDNNISYTTGSFKKLFDKGLIEMIGHSSRAALFGLTDVGFGVVEELFDGILE